MTRIFFILLISLCSCGKNTGTLPSYPPPGGYKVYHTSAHQTIIRNMDAIHGLDVPSKVIGIGWDTRFIIAKQQLLTNRNHFPGDNYEVPVPGKYAFWILDTKDSVKRYGPLDEQKFTAKRKEIGVPVSLLLKNLD